MPVFALGGQDLSTYSSVGGWLIPAEALNAEAPLSNPGG